MTIDLSIPVWSLPIDWTDGVTETLEFLTSVGESVSAIEQRRGLRLTPRQYFEYQYILKGPERTYFDLLTMRSAGSPCYLPLWHDVEVLQIDHAAGSTGIAINTTFTEFMNCDVIFLGGTYDYELCEIVGRADTLVVIATGLVNAWPKGTRVVPLKRVKVDQQPSTTRHTELVHTARVKFCSIEDNRTDAESPLNMFGLQYVLETDPNEVDDLTYTYERLMSTLDNTMGIPAMSDVTGRILQQFAWWAKGRQAHHQLRGLFYALDGRRVPVWVPTIYSDFEAMQPLTTTFDGIDVKRCGFTELGGPGPQREYIMVQTREFRHYAKITNSVVLGDGSTERLFLDRPFPEFISLDRIIRISFLVLCRLDSDAIEMTHHTATRGMTTVVAVFRSAAAKEGIENLYEVPPGVLPTAVCLANVLWHVASPAVNNTSSSDKLDKFNNYYLLDSSGKQFSVYNDNGILLATHTEDTLGAEINDYFGSPLFTLNPTYYAMYVNPIRQGNYVMVWMRALKGVTFAQWWALYEPQEDGSLVLKGAYYYSGGVVFPPYTNGVHLQDLYNDDQVIMFSAYNNFGSYDNFMCLLPSINEFIDGTYKDAGFAGMGPGRIPLTLFYPFGAVGFKHNFFVRVADNDTHNYGFRLPGNGRDLYYIYLSRKSMSNQSGSSFPNDEIKNVLQPVYPNGAMIKINLGDTDSYEDIASLVLSSAARGRATDPYTIDNPSWQREDESVAIPFLDEYTYLSTGEVGGNDTYSTQVGTQPRTNGHFWVTFLMAGVRDAIYRAGDLLSGVWESPVYAKVRLFDYDPTTEIATQIGEHVCILHTDDFLAISSDQYRVISNDWQVISKVVEADGFATVVLYGRVYKTEFCRFALPEE